MPENAVTLEDLKKSVHDLAEAVEGMNAGKVDEKTVATMIGDAIEKSRAVAPEQNQRRGYEPVDLESGPLPTLRRKGRELSAAARVEHLLTREPSKGAIWSRRSEADIKTFHQASDGLVLLEAILSNARGEAVDVRETDYYSEIFEPAFQAAVDTQTAGEGLEYVPKELSGSLIERVNLALRIPALFPQIEMPTNPYDVPALAVTRQRGGAHAEQTADTGQTKFKVLTPATRKVTLTAKKFAGRMLVSREAEEDSIIPVLGWMQDELVDFLVADIEDAILNGDTTATHMDSDTTAADDPRKQWDGLRDRTQAGAKTDAANAALTSAMLRVNRKKMGKYGVAPVDLAHLLGIAGYISLLSDVNVITVDKYGPNATILSGELARVDGIPIVVSEYIRQDLNATGVHDGVTTNRTIAATVNRRGYFQGQRRGLEVEILRELYAESDQDLILASHRKAFEARYPTTELVVSLHFNVLT